MATSCSSASTSDAASDPGRFAGRFGTETFVGGYDEGDDAGRLVPLSRVNLRSALGGYTARPIGGEAAGVVLRLAARPAGRSAAHAVVRLAVVGAPGAAVLVHVERGGPRAPSSRHRAA